MVKIHTWTRHHQAGWTEILFTSLDTHHIITSSYWHSRSYTQPHSCMLVNAVPHTDPYTSRTSVHITSIGTSAVVRVILLHIVGWKEPHLETQEQCRSDKKTANKKIYIFFTFFPCSHPAVHLSFPPATVTLLGKDLDGVSFPQRELGAVPGREVIPGPCDAKAPHAAPCETEPTLQHGTA